MKKSLLTLLWLLCCFPLWADVEICTAESGTLVTDDYGQLYYVSNPYALSSRTIRLTVLEPQDVSEYVNWDKIHPFMSIAEFYLWDGEGNRINLSARNFSTNAQEPREGDISNICDNDRFSFFHSMWTTRIDEYHYVEIDLPEDVDTDIVSFGMLSRYDFNYQFPRTFIMSGLDFIGGELTVNLDSENLDLYNNCKLQIKDCASGESFSRILTGKDTYAFKGLKLGNVYNVTLYNNYGDILAQGEDIKVEKNTIVTLSEFVNLTDLKIYVKIGDEDITEIVTVQWFDSEENFRAQGNILKGQPVGSSLKYTVLLDERLGKEYLQPALSDYTIVGEEPTPECIELELQPLVFTQVSGLVKNDYGVGLSKARVTATQKVNGKFTRTSSTQTNADGTYSISVVKDTDMEITITSNNYVTQTLNISAVSEFEELPSEFALEPIKGTVIKVHLTLTPSVSEPNQPKISYPYEDYANVSFKIFNKTADREITDFISQYPLLIVLEEIGKDDELLVTAVSNKNSFQEVSAAVDADRRVAIEILELGSIIATYDNSVENEVKALLYDNQGSLVNSSDYFEKSVRFSGLADGEYRLVTMGKSQYFNAVSRYEQFDAIGLKAGDHYLSNLVDVKSGFITNITLDQVPQLDESVFFYTCNPTTFTSNKPVADFASYVTLSGQISFKEDYQEGISDISMLIDVPSSCEFVANSVLQNGKTMPYIIEDNGQIAVPLNDLENVVKMCVIPYAGGTHSISAYVRFSDNDKIVIQPIGQADIKVHDLVINLNKVLKDSIFMVSGNARSKADVKIYDNNMLIGQTTANSNGRWSMECVLYKPYEFTPHDIYANYTLQNGTNVNTSVEKVLYRPSSFRLKKVTMINTAHYGSDVNKIYESNCVFDCNTNTVTPTSYRYWPAYPTFKFVIETDCESPYNKLQEVSLNIKTTDGKSLWKDAVFDENSDRWIATFEFYSSSSLPQNISVRINSIDFSPIDLSPSLKDDLEAMDSHIADQCQYIGTSVVKKTDTSTELFVSPKESERGFNITYESLDYETTRQKIEYFDVVDTYQGKIYVKYTEEDNGDTELIIVDEKEEVAERVTEKHPENTSPQPGNPNDQNTGKNDEEDEDVKLKFGCDKDGDIVPVNDNQTDSDITYPKVKKCKSPLDTYLDAVTPISELVFMNERANKAFMDSCLAAIYNQQQIIRDLYSAKCPDGQYALTDSVRDRVRARLLDLNEATYSYAHQAMNAYKLYLEKKRLFARIYAYGQIKDLALNIAGAIINGVKYTKFSPEVLVDFLDNWLDSNALNNFTDANGRLLELIESQRFNFDSDYLAELDRYENSVAYTSGVLVQEYQKVIRELRRNLICPQDKSNGGEVIDVPATVSVIEDPSGFVYEGVESNRLEGVTATCFYKEILEDMYGESYEVIRVWDAAEYGQVNPQLTDADGLYGWDVPQGMWQVKFEKEGYEVAYSDWLPVPPPQLDVNIPMRQFVLTEVVSAMANTKGVTVEFNKYVKSNTLNSETIRLTDPSTEEPIDVTIEFVDHDNDSGLLSKLKLVPIKPLTAGETVGLFVSENIENYVDLPMAEDFVKYLTVVACVESIETEAEMRIAVGKEKQFEINVYPTDAACGMRVNLQSYSPSIASLSSDIIELDENGYGSIFVKGCMPGNSLISYLLPEADMEGATLIYVLDNSLVQTASPVASVPTESYLKKGDTVELTCLTKGATILYTLDGSCPCGNTALLYEQPIVINEETTINAMAVAEDLDDSEIVSFHYYINEDDALTPITPDRNVKVIGVEGRIMIEGANGEKLSVYDMSGHPIFTNYAIRADHFYLNVAKGTYIVIVGDGLNKNRKVLVK